SAARLSRHDEQTSHPRVHAALRSRRRLAGAPRSAARLRGAEGAPRPPRQAPEFQTRPGARRGDPLPRPVRRGRLPARRQRGQQDRPLPAERALRGPAQGRREVSAFELSLVGGPWRRRLAPRRRWIDELPWDEKLPDAAAARAVWTQTAFS